MPVEGLTPFWDKPLFVAIVGGIIVAVIGILLTHRLTVNHERKKQKAADNTALQKEIAELKEKIAYYEDVEQSSTGDYLVLKHTRQAICPVCWGKEHRAIPLYGKVTGLFVCGACHNEGVFDHQAVEDFSIQSFVSSVDFS